MIPVTTFNHHQRNNKTRILKLRHSMTTRTSTFLKCTSLLVVVLATVNLKTLEHRRVQEGGFLVANIESFVQLPKKSNHHHHHLFEGQTLLNTLQRILSRKITASNVLIVTPDTTTATTKVTGSAGKIVYQKAEKEGHAVHVLHPPPHIDVDWWWKHDHDQRQNWFLLAFVSGDLLRLKGQPTTNSNNGVDHIMSSAIIFLSEATVTYLVLEVGVVLNADDDFPNKRIIVGRDAVQKLHDRKYKVQVLVSSHYLVEWGPNVLLTPYNIDSFFQDATNIVSRSGETFQAYLFATQGLDLAIPATTIGAPFWDYDDALKTCNGSRASRLSNNECGNGHCGIYANIQLGIRPSCPAEHSRARIEFLSNTHNNGDMASNNVLGLKLMYDDKIVTNETKGVSVWLNDMNNPSRAEAACMRVVADHEDNQKNHQPSVACTTRILKQQQPHHRLQQQKGRVELSSSKPKRFNVLSMLIDPISRTQFLHSLPRTAALLEEKQFVRFDKYTVVGANSGPNQAALFSGVPLTNGRNGISSSASHGNTNDGKHRKTQWIWDELRSSGFVTLKAEDSCIENSNMIQSLQPNVTHGTALHEMFCFSYDRPNCLGNKLAAEHLFETASKFIDAYEEQSPWAAFLSFTDSHEDSHSMVQILDDVMYDFIASLDLSKTLVVLLSDHGLHYGPHFQTLAGVKERAQPILYMHLPYELQNRHTETLQENSKLWTSHFDVHETFLEVALEIDRDENPDVIGSSLLHPFPNDRRECHGVPGIPSEYCDMVDGNEVDHAATNCANIPIPPSPLTFLADLPRHRQPQMSSCKNITVGQVGTSIPLNRSVLRKNSRHINNQSMETGSCKCATDSIGWYNCTQHPWNDGNQPKTIIGLTYCEGDGHSENAGIEVDIRIQDVAVSQLSATILADTNQFLQRQMLCVDSIISNLGLSGPPPPVSWSIFSE